MPSTHTSRFADLFHRRARPLLHRHLGELLRYRMSDGVERDLPGQWRRVDPATSSADGLGIDAAHGAARVTVAVEDLPEPDGQALIGRDGGWWAIDRIERIDAHTWILHLVVPDAEFRLPERLRG